MIITTLHCFWNEIIWAMKLYDIDLRFECLFWQHSFYYMGTLTRFTLFQFSVWSYVSSLFIIVLLFFWGGGEGEVVICVHRTAEKYLGKAVCKLLSFFSACEKSCCEGCQFLRSISFLQARIRQRLFLPSIPSFLTAQIFRFIDPCRFESG